MRKQDKIVEILKTRGHKLLSQPKADIEFIQGDNVDKILAKKVNSMYSNLTKYSYLFVLGCVMDRQMRSEKSWMIPYKVAEWLHVKRFEDFLVFNEDDFIDLFLKKKPHRFNKEMARNFYQAIQLIHTKYKDKAFLIWKGNLRSATIVLRFLEFQGVGIKIATMAANILSREYKIPMKDRICIDISPDVHIKTVFKRLGLLFDNPSAEEAIYKARELNPEYPGIFDFSVFEIGKKWCKASNPLCKKCYLNKYCPKRID